MPSPPPKYLLSLALILAAAMQFIALILGAIIVFILRRRYPDHSLKIGRISLTKMSLYDVKYSGSLYNSTYHFNFTSKRIFIRFHWPLSSTSPPHWLTFTAETIYYTSTTADISTSNLSVIFWFFPHLFRQTAGPWTNAELNHLTVRVRMGTQTPYFIKRLRQNLVGAVLEGDIYRCDDFGTTVRLSGLSDADVEEKTPVHDAEGDVADGDIGIGSDGDDGAETETEGGYDAADEDDVSTPRRDGRARTECLANQTGGFKQVVSTYKDHHPQPFLPPDEDELRISAYLRQLHLNNKEGRIYSFGAVDAQFRRNWTADRGSFVMIAKESRWVRIHWTYQRTRNTSWWIQLASSIVQFPYDLVHVFNYPMTSVNIYVPRLDITFDEFKIRDAELLLQSISIIREKMFNAGIQWQDLFVDGIAKLVVDGALQSR